jgi:hypothetical protein
LPVTCELLELEALPPDEPSEPDELDPDPSEPLLDEPDEPLPREPDEPLDDFDGSDGSVADEPELPDDPLPIDPDELLPDDPVLEESLEPLEPFADCALAGNAIRRPAIPTPAIIPFVIFMFPSRLCRWTDQAPCRVTSPVAPIR